MTTIRKIIIEPEAQAHSTLPWSVDKERALNKIVISDNDGNIVALVHAAEDTPEATSNAAFIVRACNEYETLKAQRDEATGAYKSEIKSHSRTEDERKRLRGEIEHFGKCFDREHAELLKVLAQCNEAKAHAQRLADALKGFCDLFCLNPDLDVIRQVNEARAALARWEASNQ